MYDVGLLVDMTSVRYGDGETWPDVVHNVAVCDLM